MPCASTLGSRAPELSGDELTIENIVRSYPLDESGSVIDFDENVTSVYFKARERS